MSYKVISDNTDVRVIYLADSEEDLADIKTEINNIYHQANTLGVIAITLDPYGAQALDSTGEWKALEK